jgi:RNA polymerase sigma factor (sigma-70 family)
MATSQMKEVIQHLRSAALRRDGAGLTDSQLLEDFVSRRDEATLETLVLRHAPMVWGVCRRVLGNDHDTEDAFQATFLVFVRKASSIASRELLANWLYGVAHQTARKARAIAARRRVRERQVPEMPEPIAAPEHLRHDLQSLLDHELSCLPAKYRAPIILCDLQGKTRHEAADELGCPEGTVAGRLARARMMLAKRLARHGLLVSAGSLAAVLSQEAAACVPTFVLSSTIKAASLFAARAGRAAGAISPAVVALSAGVLNSMWLTKLKTTVAVLLAIMFLGAGLAMAGLLAKNPSTAKTPDSSADKDAKNALKHTKGEEGNNRPLQARIIKPSKTLNTGHIDDPEAEKLSPPNGFVAKKEDFERLWKVWLLEEKVPEVDFQKNLVVVATSREGIIKEAVLIDEKRTGDTRIKADLERKTEGKALRVLIAVFPRAGIKSIEGRSITDE